VPGESRIGGAGAEVAIPMGGFLGVNTTDEPTRFPPGIMQQATNWIPNPVGTLQKRPGTAFFQAIPLTTAVVTQALVWALDGSGNRYLYAYVNQTTAPDALFVSTNEGPFTAVTGGTFASTGLRGGLCVMNGTVYAGNGTDPLIRVPLGGSGLSLTPPALANDTGQSAVLVADAGSFLETGTYSYRWAIFDTSTSTWPALGPVETVTVSARNDVLFTAPQAGAPATVLTATQKWHLFLPFANQPVEFGYDQTAAGLAAGATYQAITVTATGTPVPIPSTVTRTGRFLVSHRGRLFIGSASTMQVSATNVLVPGTEQVLFNQADFFPANATLTIDDFVTGIGVAALTSTPEQPQAPLAIFSNTSTWMLIGDIINDPNAIFFRLSDHIGCVAHQTIVPTPIGLLWLGHESVYWLQSSTGEPIDLGWPITNGIRQIPVSQRPFACATYHKGFYKLCVAGSADITNTVEWWLDLRPQVRSQLLSLPSWSGPHKTGAPLSCVAQAEDHPVEDDRAWGALTVPLGGPAAGIWDIAIWDVGIWGGTTGAGILLLHQPGFQDNNVTIQSVLLTARFTLGEPFSRKRVKRARCIAQVGVAQTVPISVLVDQGASGSAAAWIFPNQTGGIWDVGIWDLAVWGADQFLEGDAPLPTEPLGQSVELRVEHNLNTAITLRDLEIRVQPMDRVVG
jgi:hypothetical protein